MLFYKSKKFFQTSFFVFLIFIIAIIFLGFIPERLLNAKNHRQDTYKHLQVFGEVFKEVQDKYVEEISDKELIEAAISGMLQSLDPHSSFLGSNDYDEMKVKTKGKFGGLGIEVTLKDGVVKVVSPIDDTPASKAGIKSGDLIIGIDGSSIRGLSLGEAVEKLRGPVGSKVNITILRDKNDPFDITIKREIIKISSVKSNTIFDIGYIKLKTFSETTTNSMRDEIKKIKKKLGNNLKGFILDLRNNPGGLLDQSISVTDTFLSEGEIVSTRGRKNDDTKRFFATDGDILDNLPLVIIINNGSASASEIVAGALKDHGRAIILGTRSFGKGSVQSIIPIQNDGAIRLTTARYFTPSGVSIQAKGIDPDILVEEIKEKNKNLSENNIREEDLSGALDKSNLENERKENNNFKKYKKLLEDNQISRAIDLIKGINLFGSNSKMIKKNF